MAKEIEYDDEISSEYDEAPEEKLSGKKRRLKNLKQFKNTSMEEFDKIYEEIENNVYSSKFFEEQIEEHLKKFEDDYDLSDLKVNDRSTLRALIQSIMTLEKFEQMSFKIQSLLSDPKYAITGLSELERLGRIMTVIRSDISRMQEDLKITRKIRKSDREESVIAYIDNVKARAKKFIETRYGRVFCPKCHMLIGSVWAKDSDSANNKFWFYCKRCDERVIITFPELIKKGFRNVDNVPEF